LFTCVARKLIQKLFEYKASHSKGLMWCSEVWFGYFLAIQSLLAHRMVISYFYIILPSHFLSEKEKQNNCNFTCTVIKYIDSNASTRISGSSHGSRSKESTLPSSRGIFDASSSLYIWKDNQINEPFQHMKITKREM